ncbi:MAG: TA system VapC family ribonuclease toxin [Leptospirales bacterium]
MIFCDVNILVYAHRADSPDHAFYKKWLLNVINSRTSFAVNDTIFSGFLRIITHRKIFKTPSTFEHGEQFVKVLREHPNAMPIIPDDDHWFIFTELCKKYQCSGNLVPDAYIAALAMGSGCTLATADRDFDRFKKLKVVHPFDERDF